MQQSKPWNTSWPNSVKERLCYVPFNANYAGPMPALICVKKLGGPTKIFDLRELVHRNSFRWGSGKEPSTTFTSFVAFLIDPNHLFVSWDAVQFRDICLNVFGIGHPGGMWGQAISVVDLEHIYQYSGFADWQKSGKDCPTPFLLSNSSTRECSANRLSLLDAATFCLEGLKSTTVHPNSFLGKFLGDVVCTLRPERVSQLLSFSKEMAIIGATYLELTESVSGVIALMTPAVGQNDPLGWLQTVTDCLEACNRSPCNMA